MMLRHQARGGVARRAVTVLAALAAAMLLACSSSSGEGAAAPSSNASASSSGSGSASTPAAAATASPRAAGAGTAAPAAPGDPLFTRGKEIFEKTAGGVGCASCHGMDGKGNGPANVGAPANRGADEARVRTALRDVELMQSVKLTDEEIKAVVVYLEYLGKQP